MSDLTAQSSSPPQPAHPADAAADPSTEINNPAANELRDSPPDPFRSRCPARWLLASLLGLCVAVLIISIAQRAEFPAFPASCAAILLGLACTALAAPWSDHRRLTSTSLELRTLTQWLNFVREGRRTQPLREMIIDRDDDIGNLSRAIFECAQESIANRIESRMLNKSMEETIQRQTQRATHQLQREASSDPLTGLGNRRGLMEYFTRRAAIPGIGEQRLVAMSMDMDRFKAVNDTLGHEIGDECLKFLGSVVKSTLRKDDFGVRLGGDEFVVLMPGIPLTDAREAAQRLLTLFGQMPWAHKSPSRPGLSIGVASAWMKDLGTVEELLRRADAALYQSKRAGRGRYTVFEDLSVTNTAA